LDSLLRFVATLYSSLLDTRTSMRVYSNDFSVVAWYWFPTGDVSFPLISRTVSAISFSQQQLATIQPQQFSNWLQLSQSQSYFTAGGLPPISSSWCQAPWDSRSDIFFQLNPCDHSLSSMCLWIIFRISFLNSLPLVDMRLIGRKFWGKFGSLLSFGNVITFVSFQGFGNWDGARCTTVLLGRYLRLSLLYHRVHKNLSIWMNLLIHVRHRALLIPKGCRLQIHEHDLDSGLHLSLMVFVAQLMRGELVF
jgi:hypothetical protein